MRSLLVAGAVIVALATPAHADPGSLDPLLHSAAERVATADQVAAANHPHTAGLARAIPSLCS